MTLSNPLAGDLHVNQPLTNFSQTWLQNATSFIASTAFPNLPVQKQSDLYWIFNRGDFYRDEARERADATESAGSGFTMSTSPYFAKVYAFHKDVTDRQRANADSIFGLDSIATKFVTRKMLIRKELLFLDTFMKPAIWGTTVTGVAAAPGAGQFLRWDVSTSDPIADVQLGMETVQGRSGYRPNKMLLSRRVWNKLVNNDSILARISGGANANTPAIVMRSLIAALFELEAIYIIDAVVNTAPHGAAETTSFMAGNDALLYYAPNTVGQDEPTAGVTFSWTGFMGATENGIRIKRFRMEEIESDRIEGQMAMTNAIIGSELGYFFDEAIS